MSIPFVDTDVLVRLIAGDDRAKQDRAIALFERVEAGTLSIQAPDTVIADAIYVLCAPRLYHLPRTEVAERLATLVRLSQFVLPNRPALLTALAIFATTTLDFGDAMLLASMQAEDETTLYSFDTDFDAFEAVTRLEP